ncbi:MAG TPA: TIGR03960 family B12-binding radical SAM protein [Bacillota bacterium]|nr:TIGR03960 family B12-binding radical SAM protein [Bacillota bacterium]
MAETMQDLLRRVEKPGRYTGGEFGEIRKEKRPGEVTFAFCFPDSYEIGMSNLGMKILYGALNANDFIRCERCFAPWPDMGDLMQSEDVPLATLESGTALRDFDIVAFSMGYELCYTNVLYMLRLAGIPLSASERKGKRWPVILGGGVCTYNPEPLAEFFDAFSIGEGEVSLCDFTRLYRDCRDEGKTKEEFLRRAASEMADEGIYVPSLYNASYNDDGTLRSFTPRDGAPAKIRKAVIEELDSAFYPECPVVPFIEAIHDRVMLETARGCIRGCRFCQAGMVCRPYRERSPEKLQTMAQRLVNNTGYDEISMMSLSISDYTKLPQLTDSLLEWTDKRHVSLSLPSMRVDSFYRELMEKVMSVRKSGITFAPEAGSQRMRDVINKNITEHDILTACETAFECGKSSVKLYFMNGLPGETDEDIVAIAKLGQSVLDCFFTSPSRKKGMSMAITLSVACFVPKPFTPFQWVGQTPADELLRRQKLLSHSITNKRITHNYHDSSVSFLEAVFARGNRNLAAALRRASERGFRFDSWDEYFKLNDWAAVFAETGIDPAFYANRTMSFDELLPWDFIDIGVTKKFLVSEAEKALCAETTPDCRTKCSGCGAMFFAGGNSVCRK